MAELRRIQLKQLSSACPEAYDAFFEDKQVGYLRLRHGCFSVHCPDSEGECVYDGSPNGDGIFDDEEERRIFLQRAVNAIVRWLDRVPEEKLAEFEYAGWKDV